MDAIFANAPTEPTLVAIHVGKIYYAARCSIRRCTASVTANIRPVDHIGRPQANLDVCSPHAEPLIQRAHAKGLEVSRRS
jgi:hypothetical protein